MFNELWSTFVKIRDKFLSGKSHPVKTNSSPFWSLGSTGSSFINSSNSDLGMERSLENEDILPTVMKLNIILFTKTRYEMMLKG